MAKEKLHLVCVHGTVLWTTVSRTTIRPNGNTQRRAPSPRKREKPGHISADLTMIVRIFLYLKSMKAETTTRKASKAIKADRRPKRGFAAGSPIGVAASSGRTSPVDRRDRSWLPSFRTCCLPALKMCSRVVGRNSEVGRGNWFVRPVPQWPHPGQVLRHIRNMAQTPRPR